MYTCFYWIYLFGFLSLWSVNSLAQGSPSSSNNSSFSGLRFGIGLALIVPFDFSDEASVREAIVDGNGIVRSVIEDKRSPKLVLESHYFFNSDKIMGWDFCPGDTPCAHGPYVAIEAGANGQSTISAYSLGWMIGFKRSAEESDLNSWNIGLGYVVRTPVRVLGDGIELNRPLPENDELRYRDVSRPGFMLLTSFSF